MKKLLTLFSLSFLFTQSWAQSPQCIEGDCFNGQGILIYASGTEKYIGEFRDGKRHGQGQYIDDCCDPAFGGGPPSTYFGGWVDGKKNGLGVFREGEPRGPTTGTKTGSVYVGEWRDDKREGLGTQQIYIPGDGIGLKGFPSISGAYSWEENNLDKQPAGTMPYREANYDSIQFSRNRDGFDQCHEYVGPWKADKKDGQGLFTVATNLICPLIPDSLIELGFNVEDVDQEIAQLYGLENPSGARIKGGYNLLREVGCGADMSSLTSTERSTIPRYPILLQIIDLCVGDIILEVDGSQVRDSSDLRLLLSTFYGMEPEITIYRDGEYLTLSVAIYERFVETWRPKDTSKNSPYIHYEGGFKEGFYNGRGSYTKYHDPDGLGLPKREYNGDFLNGAFHGQGTLVYETGDIYSGDWITGHRHGQGTYTYPDGYTYSGEWKQGRQGSRYLLDGEYIDDFRAFARQKAEAARQLARREAEAARQLARREVEIAREAEERYFQQIADGRCIEGDCTNGQGTFVFTNGRTIVGEWKNGRRHGSVTMNYPNGSSYTGIWQDGDWCGEALSC